MSGMDYGFPVIQFNPMIQCPRCDGTGKTYGMPGLFWVDCYNCRGTGTDYGTVSGPWWERPLLDEDEKVEP